MPVVLEKLYAVDINDLCLNLRFDEYVDRSACIVSGEDVSCTKCSSVRCGCKLLNFCQSYL